MSFDEDDLIAQLRAVFGDTEVRIIQCDETGMHDVTREPELLPAMEGGWILVDADGNRVYRGRRFISRGEAYRVTGGHPPRHASSSGRVFVATDDVSFEDEPFHSIGLFPHVFDLKWEKLL